MPWGVWSLTRRPAGTRILKPLKAFHKGQRRSINHCFASAIRPSFANTWATAPTYRPSLRYGCKLYGIFAPSRLFPGIILCLSYECIRSSNGHSQGLAGSGGSRMFSVDRIRATVRNRAWVSPWVKGSNWPVCSGKTTDQVARPRGSSPKSSWEISRRAAMSKAVIASR